MSTTIPAGSAPPGIVALLAEGEASVAAKRKLTLVLTGDGTTLGDGAGSDDDPTRSRVPRRAQACRLEVWPVENVVVESLCAQVKPARCAALGGVVAGDVGGVASSGDVAGALSMEDSGATTRRMCIWPMVWSSVGLGASSRSVRRGKVPNQQRAAREWRVRQPGERHR